jgi:hypothetical protein
MENKNNHEEKKRIFDLCCGKNWKGVLRWILVIAILTIVFGFGFALGKFSAILRGGYYGYPMMGSYYHNMMRPGNYGGYYYGPMNPWIMQGWNQGTINQPQTNPPR